MGNSRIFGYDKHDCKLTINESEAEMVRLIYELYSTGDYSSRKIENILWEKGYRNRNGSRIHHNTINGAIKELEQLGYLRRRYPRNSHGRIDHAEYTVCDIPLHEYETLVVDWSDNSAQKGEDL